MSLPVECQGHMLDAQVFMPTIHATAHVMGWDFASWASTERPLFMAMVHERMKRYGELTAAENHALWPQMKAEVALRFRDSRPDLETL